MKIVDLIKNIEKVGYHIRNEVYKLIIPNINIKFKNKTVYAIQYINDNVYIKDYNFKAIKLNAFEEGILKSWVKNVLNK